MAAPSFTDIFHLAPFLLFFTSVLVSSAQQLPHNNNNSNPQNLLSCDSKSPDAFGYRCTGYSPVNHQCKTYAILRTNSYYSSLFNLSSCLGLNRFAIADANGFSADTEFLPKDQLLLIPIDCQCSGNVFAAELTKTALKGETFEAIAESLEGLTTCDAIKEKNPGVSPWGAPDKLRLLVPLRCACPASPQHSRLLLSYPVSPLDTIATLSSKFNASQNEIIAENDRSVGGGGGGGRFRPETKLIPFTSLLIPFNEKPLLGPLAKPREPNLRFPETNVPAISPPKKRSKMHKIGLYFAVSGVIVGASIAIAAACLLIQLKKKKQTLPKPSDVELQQLSVSVRTTSDKKVSFEGSQDALDGQVIESTTPRKVPVETYSVEELRKATEDFSSSNHIEGSVYHGRLSGKNLAIKSTKPEIVLKIEFGLFHDAIHHHPNIMRLLGKCLSEGHESESSFLVFEYAKNGSLKDWLHGGLAIKNQFIASCYCFLTWSQRLRICLDVAMALQYMHHIMNPSYVHRNVKSRNIFLDEEFNAKIGNFGMAKCVEIDTDDQKSWSVGYLAPEYVHGGVISTSLDIFAYGVVLLEVLSGQTPVTRPNEKAEGNLLLSETMKSVLQSDDADDLREWMDSALGEGYSFKAAVTLANLASACVHEDPNLRPSAGEIVEKLSRLVEEAADVEGENILMSESSCKPLVKAAAGANNG